MSSTTRTPAPKIVVGVDGSESSIAALRWAARQAELTGAALHVVTAWSYPEHPTPFGIVPPLPLPTDPLSNARRQLAEVVDAELERHTGLTIHTEVVHGNAAPVLLDAARDADLLVVGSRGQGKRSLACCWARSASTASGTPPAQCSSSATDSNVALPLPVAKWPETSVHPEASRRPQRRGRGSRLHRFQVVRPWHRVHGVSHAG